MTKEELLQRLTDIEWDDFEVKEAQNKMPNNVWETKYHQVFQICEVGGKRGLWHTQDDGLGAVDWRESDF